MDEMDAAVERARAIIGKKVGLGGTREVERGAIARFVEAINDPNPLWVDREYAATTRFGDVIAPPSFLNFLIRAPIDVTKDQRPHPVTEVELPLARALNGGIEWDFREPVRPGDMITSEARIADIKKQDGKSGSMILVITETTFTNQHDQVVAVSRFTRIYR